MRGVGAGDRHVITYCRTLAVKESLLQSENVLLFESLISFSHPILLGFCDGVLICMHVYVQCIHIDSDLVKSSQY